MRLIWSWLVFIVSAAIAALLVAQGVVEGDAADLHPTADSPTITLLLIAGALAALLAIASFFVALITTLRAAGARTA